MLKVMISDLNANTRYCYLFENDGNGRSKIGSLTLKSEREIEKVKFLHTVICEHLCMTRG